MMPVKKILNSLMFRCIYAVSIGVMIAVAAIALLFVHGQTQELAPKTASKTWRFPENEKMLDDLSDQLAREGEAMSTIAPAAGEQKKH